MDDKKLNRYGRQMILKNFGSAAQQKLEDARVLIIGVGGLGCPVLMYLTAAGVGTIGIADGDSVDLNNLHRQILFDTNDVGWPKVQVAAEKMKLKNPEVKVMTYHFFISPSNITDVVANFDVVVDATDNFSSRYLISDACVLMKKPFVYGAVSTYEGQVGVFNYNPNGTAVNYRDLFPVPPASGEVHSCNTEGVLGTLPGIIGMMQANEVIKLITGIGSPLINKLFTIDMSDFRTYEMEVLPAVHSGMPSTIDELTGFDYDSFCACEHISDDVISAATLIEFMEKGDCSLIDVRENVERTQDEVPDALGIPLSTLEIEIENLELRQTVIFVCASGVRSFTALELAKKVLKEKKLFSLKDGLRSLKKFEKYKEVKA